MRENWFTDEERAQLLANGARTAAGESHDPIPLVLLHLPDSGWRWLISELDPVDEDLAYGICDLRIGLPETGEIRLSELEMTTGAARMPVERDRRYKPSPDLPISRLDRMAWEAGRIVV